MHALLKTNCGALPTCRINKASQEWLDGIRKPVPGGQGGFVDNDEPDGSSSEQNEQASEEADEEVPSEQEKATATTSA